MNLSTIYTLRRIAASGGPLVGAAAVAWMADFSLLEGLLLLYVAGAAGQILGVYLEERAQGQRAQRAPAGLMKLVGAHGVIATDCSPRGTIRIGFELWDARPARAESIGAGARVIVVDAEGRTLVVERLTLEC